MNQSNKDNSESMVEVRFKRIELKDLQFDQGDTVCQAKACQIARPITHHTHIVLWERTVWWCKEGQVEWQGGSSESLQCCWTKKWLFARGLFVCTCTHTWIDTWVVQISHVAGITFFATNSWQNCYSARSLSNWPCYKKSEFSKDNITYRLYYLYNNYT